METLSIEIVPRVFPDQATVRPVGKAIIASKGPALEILPFKAVSKLVCCGFEMSTASMLPMIVQY